MVRSAAVLTSLIVFPGIVLAQEQPAGESGDLHTVERGESLWNLARRYYEDPFEWRRILEANDGKIENPHWIYPGQDFTIPGIGVTVTAVGVEGEAQGEEEMIRMADGSAAAPLYPGPDDPTIFSDPPREDTSAAGERTAFYGPVGARRTTERGGVLAGEAVEHLAVSRHDFFSAPWRVPEEGGGDVSYPGRVGGWAGAQAAGGFRETIRPYDRIEVRWSDEPLPSEGDRLHMVRVDRSEEGFGSVIRPTATARVVERGDSAVVAVLLSAFTRPRIGDYAAVAPSFPLEPGQYSREASGDDLVVTLEGFAVPRTIQQIGDVAFLDAGARDGVRVGDVFSAQVTGEGGGSAEDVVRFRVVRVFDDRSSARVSSVTTPVFRAGSDLRRVRRMP